MVPGKRVNVQVPDEGNPFNITLPVGTEHVGWVITPGTGAGGVSGCAGIITLPDDCEMHPAELVTVKV